MVRRPKNASVGEVKYGPKGEGRVALGVTPGDTPIFYSFLLFLD
jgi:hypothetical protein